MQRKNYLFQLAGALWVALGLLFAGPARAQCPTGSTELSTTNGDFPAGQMTQWTVPAGVTEVTILSIGGEGGYGLQTNPFTGQVFFIPGGEGATAQATLPVSSGDVLNVIVAGQAGIDGGGGGSGVYNATANDVLIVAGGGGGGSTYFGDGQGGRSTEQGGNGGFNTTGGTNGNGGGAGASSGGGGAFSAGADGSLSSTGGGQGVPNGGSGGTGPNGNGAFGLGGGGGGSSNGAAGGGGGYSGGAGSFAAGTASAYGGGGGSFVHASGTDVSITAGANGGASIPGFHGVVYVCYVECDIAIDNISTTDESCPGANDGAIAVTASCTTCTSIEYSIDGTNFQAGNAFSGLAPGAYTVTVRDAGDVSCEATGNTTVEAGTDTDAPAPDVAVLPTVTGECSATIATAPTATDNCDGTITGTTADPTTYTEQGTFTVTWIFYDGIGNASTQTQTVVVDDSTPPAISCPANIVTGNAPGVCEAAVSYAAVTATDNCAGVSIAQSAGLGSGATFPVGVTTESYTATDAGGNQTSCSFTVTVNKTGDPGLLDAYTVIGFKEVKMKENTVLSGGVGVVNAGKKAKLEKNTMVTAANTFVQAPELDLKSGSQVANYIAGQVDANLLPAFQPGNACNNDVDIPDNSAPVTLSGDCYDKVKIGKNVSVTFSGNATVQVKEMDMKDGSSLFFNQNTNLLIEKGFKGDKEILISNGGHEAWIFAEDKVEIKEGSSVSCNIYTLKDLNVEGDDNAPTTMSGLFISADKVYAKEHVTWNWNPGCGSTNLPSGNRATALSNTPVAVDQPQPQLETRLELVAFPNPFRNQVSFRYYLPTDSRVQLNLYSMQGKEVAKLLDGQQPAGSQQLEWTGGTELPAGIYFARLQTENGVSTLQLVLAR
ncbi:MAG: HYR domain-containing protein [Lewinellaceae bacterium]|nr:HYR domain-containing protein [Lewinellaceae bacterium]